MLELQRRCRCSHSSVEWKRSIAVDCLKQIEAGCLRPKFKARLLSRLIENINKRHSSFPSGHFSLKVRLVRMVRILYVLRKQYLISKRGVVTYVDHADQGLLHADQRSNSSTFWASSRHSKLSGFFMRTDANRRVTELRRTILPARRYC
jgi:hypothetical protein